MNAVDLLKQLVACPSITPNSANALELVAEVLQQAGFTIEYLPSGEVNNLWAFKGNGDVCRLLFAGHVDVVPPGDLTQWQTDPFTPIEKDGVLYGRGAADMKSGVAAFVSAAANCAKDGVDGVGVFLTTDEEGPAEEGTRHFVEWWQAQKKPPIEWVVVGEPTSEDSFADAIKIGRRGSLTAFIEVRAKQEHVAFAHQKNNSAVLLIGALNAIQNKYATNADKQAQGLVNTTFQVVELQAGLGVTNVTPPVATATINFRHVANEPAAMLCGWVEEVLQENAKDRWQCRWVHAATPYTMPADGTLITTLQNILQNKYGRTAKLSNAGGASDGRFLRDIATQLIEFGVLNKTIHAPNENVKIDDVRDLQNIYQSLIRCI